MDITISHLEGSTAYARQIGMTLFEAFLNVEERFQRGTEATEQEIIDELRQVRGFGCVVWLCLVFAVVAVASSMLLRLACCSDRPAGCRAPMLIC